TTGVTYVSRLADAEAFGGLALVETHRRGTQTAGTVAAVADGSEWIQRLVDLHRPDAVRILDFAPPVQHGNLAAPACLRGGRPAGGGAGAPAGVRGALPRRPRARPAAPAAAARAREATLGYLSKRREQVAYARFRALGLPIGSGMVESANKNVVERRLKGAG